MHFAASNDISISCKPFSLYSSRCNFNSKRQEGKNPRKNSINSSKNKSPFLDLGARTTPAAPDYTENLTVTETSPATSTFASRWSAGIRLSNTLPTSTVISHKLKVYIEFIVIPKLIYNSYNYIYRSQDGSLTWAKEVALHW